VTDLLSALWYDNRDVVVLVSLIAGVPFCFFFPWAGAMLWGWDGFLLPNRLARSQVVGTYYGWMLPLAALAGLAVSGKRHSLPRSREMYLLLALWAFCGLTTAVAIYPERAWVHLIELSRILAMILVVIALSQDRRTLTILMWATAVPLGCYAVGGVVWLMLTGGAHPLYGPRAADVENNNDLAAALIAVLPFFVFLARGAPRRWMAYGALGLFGASIVAILGTYSRAAVIALVVVLVALALCRQWRALAIAAAAWLVFVSIAPQKKWYARVDTIRTYQQDSSAVKRLSSWYVALRLGLDHPLFGAGFRPFSPETYQRYIPGYSDYHDAHNHFLQVLAEHGFIGLAIYTALIASTLATLWRMARPPPQPGAEWVQDYSRMLLIGLLAFIVDGMFHCLSYRTIFFDLLALSIIVDAVARAPAHVVAPVRGGASELTPWRWLVRGRVA
jgi:probable O-glycosylation ligase (exosortase A-associated)